MSPKRRRSRADKKKSRDYNGSDQRRDGSRRGKRRHEGERFDRKVRHSTGIKKLRATFDKNQKGFGFLVFEAAGMEDIFVPPRQAQALFHGDRVEVTLSGRGEILSLKVVEHRFRELVGRYLPNPAPRATGGWVVYERKRAREEVYAPAATKARPGDWVRAKLEFHQTGPFPVTAEIVDVYGSVLPASIDVQMVAAEFNLIEHHSETAEREARALPTEFPVAERRDLRGVPFITIDGETARDFDDAVFVERLKSGHRLWVAIADVSHYVTPGSALDKEARSRGTSVYFPERAFHMLPRPLSENLCSLRPNEPRYALAVAMDFNFKGKRVKTQLMEALIQSRRRATYNEIQAEFEANGKNSGWEYSPHFELYRILRKARSDRGSIDFDLPEAEMVIRPDGEVESITRRPRLDSHRLIEEFMIAANEAVTVWALERKWPFVYRIHEQPAMESLERFQDLAANMGIRFSIDGASDPAVMADIIRRLEGHPAQTLLNMAFLRSMRQAVYSSTLDIHYGLASDAYTHFTSPIRRYPDLLVHRMLRHALRTEQGREQGFRKGAREKVEDDLRAAAEHCSYRERLATDAEREARKLKQVRAMLPRLGDEFDGKIVGLIAAGIFVQIEDPYVEGLLPVDGMTDDFYEFDEDRMIYRGKRTKRIYRLGDLVRVRAVRADLDRRQVDFGKVETTGKTYRVDSGTPNLRTSK